jgi:hypothetical protein
MFFALCHKGRTLCHLLLVMWTIRPKYVKSHTSELAWRTPLGILCADQSAPFQYFSLFSSLRSCTVFFSFDFWTHLLGKTLTQLQSRIWLVLNLTFIVIYTGQHNLVANCWICHREYFYGCCCESNAGCSEIGVFIHFQSNSFREHSYNIAHRL